MFQLNLECEIFVWRASLEALDLVDSDWLSVWGSCIWELLAMTCTYSSWPHVTAFDMTFFLIGDQSLSDLKIFLGRPTTLDNINRFHLRATIAHI